MCMPNCFAAWHLSCLPASLFMVLVQGWVHSYCCYSKGEPWAGKGLCTTDVACVQRKWVELLMQQFPCHKPHLQGFPNFSPPSFLIDALTEAAQQPLLNQYTRGHGHPRLVKALAKMYGQLQGREIDPMTEVHAWCSNFTSLVRLGSIPSC